MKQVRIIGTGNKNRAKENRNQKFNYLRKVWIENLSKVIRDLYYEASVLI